MKIFDNIFTWIFLLAVITVIFASDKSEKAVQAISQMVQSLIKVITSPQTGSK